MKLRPLIIDDTTKARIAAVVAHAEKNMLQVDDLLDTLNKEKAPVGDDPAFTCTIEVGYRCVFSLEQQPAGLVRHLSVSVDEKTKLPSVTAVEEIMKLFGFVGGLEGVNTVDIETIDLLHLAINVLQVVRPTETAPPLPPGNSASANPGA